MRIAISGSGLPPDNPLVLEAASVVSSPFFLVGGNSNILLMFIPIYLGFHDPTFDEGAFFFHWVELKPPTSFCKDIVLSRCFFLEISPVQSWIFSAFW